MKNRRGLWLAFLSNFPVSFFELKTRAKASKTQIKAPKTVTRLLSQEVEKRTKKGVWGKKVKKNFGNCWHVRHSFRVLFFDSTPSVRVPWLQKRPLTPATAVVFSR